MKYHSLCLDKKEIILAQLQARTKLYPAPAIDKKTIEIEIPGLKMAIDLMNLFFH